VRFALAIAAASLAACTATISHEKVAGWPALEVVEHHLPHQQMLARCARWAQGMTPLACAEFDFTAARCDIFYSAERPPSRAIVAHERLHCQGHDHAGESAMREHLARYRAWQSAANKIGTDPISR
jgi:hypothetical protein